MIAPAYPRSTCKPALSRDEVQKMYDSLRVKQRFDSVTPDELDWMDWAEWYLNQKDSN